MAKKRKTTNKSVEFKAVDKADGNIELIEEIKYAYKRDRKFCLVTYIDEEYLLKYLKTASYIEHWCYIYHDMDLDEKGKPKPNHYHVLIYTRDGKTESAVLKNFNRYSTEVYRFSEQPAQNTLCEFCTDMVVMYRYLLHLDDPDKYPYSSERRKHDFLPYWTELENSDGATQNNIGLMIETDILRGMSEFDLVVKYGNAYIFHRPNYWASVNAIKREQIAQQANQCNILDLIRVILEESIFSNEQINNFYSILSHLKAECSALYDSELNLYLDVERNLKDGKQ